MSTTGAKLCPQICPWNNALIAHTCSGDLYLSHSITGSSVRLTHAKKGGRSLVDDPLSAGTPSYVMQEEFTRLVPLLLDIHILKARKLENLFPYLRYIGYWWQPKSMYDGIYRIVYEEVDESDVKIYCFPSANSYEVDEFRFPRAGMPNARSNLKMVQFRLTESLQIIDIEILELQYPLHIMFPWMEYMVRVGWTPDAQ